MNIDTKALRALREQATAGEWEAASEDRFGDTWIVSASEPVVCTNDVNPDDTALILGAVNNLIPLLDEIDRLRAENAALKETSARQANTQSLLRPYQKEALDYFGSLNPQHMLPEAAE